MVPIYCVMFSNPISDDVRDTLFANAYLMLKTFSKKKRVKTSFCEGVIKTDLKPVALYGMNGVVFNARLETDKGDLTVSYMVRHQNLKEMEETEHGVWLEDDELDETLPASKLRPNPIRAVAKKHLEN